MEGFGDPRFTGILESGVHLIEKPFNETSLVAKLHEILRRGTGAGRRT